MAGDEIELVLDATDVEACEGAMILLDEGRTVDSANVEPRTDETAVV